MTQDEKAEDYDRLQYEFTQINQDLKIEKRKNKALTKQLNLPGVSQQRELLIDFMNKTQGKLIWGWNIGGGEKLADEYLKGNL